MVALMSTPRTMSVKRRPAHARHLRQGLHLRRTPREAHGVGRARRHEPRKFHA